MTLFIAKFRHAQSFALPTELWHQYKQKKSHSIKSNSSESGTTRNRTGDTRIFSPLLYQLSYGTILTSNIKLDVSFAGAKVALYFETCKYFGNFLTKKQKKSRFTI